MASDTYGGPASPAVLGVSEAAEPSKKKMRKWTILLAFGNSFL
jgi:hypothetical protein